MREIWSYRTLKESKDKMDSYLSRFEKYAIANKWDKNVWATYLSVLLKGRTLDVYDRLSTEDAADYDKLKDALLKNFDMTERGFRFIYSRPERSETFIQYSSRPCNYRWLSLSQSPGDQTKYFELSVVWDSQFEMSFTLYMYRVA